MLEFELPDQNGEPFRLSAELGRGAVVVVFYRGDWWPYCNGQLVELARRHAEFRGAGAELVAVSVDPVGASAGMTEKLRLPFPLLSDPDGTGAIRPFGVWDAEEDDVARVATVVLAPDGREVFRHVGADYTDRPVEGDVLEAVRALRLAPREAAAGVHARNAPEPSRRAETRHEVAVYMRGVRSSTKALYQRTGDERVGDVWRMAARYFDALSET